MIVRCECIYKCLFLFRRNVNSTSKRPHTFDGPWIAELEIIYFSVSDIGNAAVIDILFEADIRKLYTGGENII